MKSEKVARRSVLMGLAVVPVSALINKIHSQSPDEAHDSVNDVSASVTDTTYVPKFFNPHEYATLRSLCQAIIPSDDHWGGAIEAYAPEFIDLLTSENEDFQERLGGGILWLDATCQQRYGETYLHCSAAQQNEMLDLIGFTASRERDPSLNPGVNFFAFLRQLTADGFFTSKVGIAYLGYIGNTYLTEFPGCPPVPPHEA